MGASESVESELHELRQKVAEQEWTMKQLDGIVAEFYRKYPEHTKSVPILRPSENPLIATLRCIVSSLDNKATQLEKSSTNAQADSNSKDSFLASISHEIRTPMNGIVGMLDLVLETDLNAEQSGYLQTIQRSTRSLLRILNDVLDYSKICSHGVELEVRPFSPEDVLEEVIQVFGPNAHAKGLQIGHTVTDVTPQQVMGDDLRVRQVLWNLVNNAIKFTAQGTVDISVCSAPAGEGKWDLWFEVTDTGIGMSAEQLSRLFKPYEQGEPSTARRYGGTGLGLAIAKNLVELMGGAIEVESEPGLGSIFRFRLRLDEVQPLHAVDEPPQIRPLSPPAAPQRPVSAAAAQFPSRLRDISDEILVSARDASQGTAFQPANPAPQHTTGHVAAPRKVFLLVEDNEINQMVARLTLERLGYEVDTADNGLEAIEAAKTRTYDVICMDVTMPDIDGLEATRRIRQLPCPTAHAKIIATTGHAYSDDRKRCLEAGMDEFISKPFEIKQLKEVIDRVLSMGRMPSQSPSSSTERVTGFQRTA
ncbi:MAG: signal transduction histidine kinase/FixJ family two-component response regulator [Verrucomicrobiales bacterium]|jgi:signal transduction histidine kinase/FixJ family two-component response regulator